MSSELEIILKAGDPGNKRYWVATAQQDGSPMWDGSGPTPDMALYDLAEELLRELVELRERTDNG